MNQDDEKWKEAHLSYSHMTLFAYLMNDVSASAIARVRSQASGSDQQARCRGE